jgi:hypothetical protein
MAKEKTGMDLSDYEKQFVKVYPTAENPYHQQNKSQMVHPDVAKALVAKGYMTEEEPEGWEEEPEEEELPPQPE